MESHKSELNQRFATCLIEAFVEQGVRYFCLAPGSRNAPLILAVSNHPLVDRSIHFDERALCFDALGFAKATGLPAAVIVTSGTALGNLLPGVMEAHHSHIPMILLTADRPPELRHTDANQTTDQVKIFQNFVRWQGDFPCPDIHLSPCVIGSTVAHAVAHARGAHAGPVHLNCMLRKPLFADGPTYKPSRRDHTHISRGHLCLSEGQIKQLSGELAQYERGVILVGDLGPSPSLYPICALSKCLKWPLFPDILSPLRSYPELCDMVAYHDLILQGVSIDDDLLPDAVLQLGGRFVSKKLTDWIAYKPPACHIHIISDHHFAHASHLISHKWIASPSKVAALLVRHLPKQNRSVWFERWRKLDRAVETLLNHFFEKNEGLSGPALFHHLPSWVGANTSFYREQLAYQRGQHFFLS